MSTFLRCLWPPWLPREQRLLRALSSAHRRLRMAQAQRDTWRDEAIVLANLNERLMQLVERNKVEQMARREYAREQLTNGR